jgi:hypothetical protein
MLATSVREAEQLPMIDDSGLDEAFARGAYGSPQFATALAPRA